MTGYDAEILRALQKIAEALEHIARQTIGGDDE